MKNIVILAISVLATGCAMGADSGENATEPERAAEMYIGYCQLDSSNLKTGYCVGGSQLCQGGWNKTACVPGSAGVSPQFWAYCGVGKFDSQTRCAF